MQDTFRLTSKPINAVELALLRQKRNKFLITKNKEKKEQRNLSFRSRSQLVQKQGSRIFVIRQAMLRLASVINLKQKNVD